jgi:hypothetical protein
MGIFIGLEGKKTFPGWGECGVETYLSIREFTFTFTFSAKGILGKIKIPTYIWISFT